jgi:hypothetical protein
MGPTDLGEKVTHRWVGGVRKQALPVLDTSASSLAGEAACLCYACVGCTMLFIVSPYAKH